MANSDPALAAAPAETATPLVGVVIPVWGHSVLFVEALESAREQQGVGARIVVVDDGCPFEETRDVARAYATTCDDVTLVSQRNQGLSAARNAGVDHLLARHPDLEAVYFLDADNRLRPFALARAAAALRAAPAGVGWIYPDIHMFGVEDHWDYGGDYSALLHHISNVSEAGSLVSAALLRSGVRFDTTLKHGYEDWDFFLSALGAGYRGQHLPGFGFDYRRRGESMLVEATRQDQDLRATLRKKHRAFFRLSNLLRLEHREAPRYAILLADSGRVMFATDPAAPAEDLALEVFVERYWGQATSPSRIHCPPFLAVSSRQALERLKAAGLLRWAFWRLERAVQTSAFAFLGGRSDDIVQGPRSAQESDGAHLKAMLGMTSKRILSEVISDSSSAWLETLTSAQPEPAIQVFDAGLGSADLDDAPPVTPLFSYVVNALRTSRWRRGVAMARPLKPGLPDRSSAYLAARDLVGSPEAATFPVARPADERHVGFILPFVSFGGVEKVAERTAQVLAEAGFTPHLFVWGRSPFRLPRAFTGAFASVTPIDLGEGDGWDAEVTYLGAETPSMANRPQAQADVLGALGWLDAVINCHSVGGHALMGRLRALGVRTLAHQHVIDQSAYGRPVGHPVVGLAFEHAYDAVICCSRSLGEWMHGMGLPQEKLLIAPNAPGVRLAPAQALAATEGRRARAGSGRLRVLFMGRFDRQKGVERLVEAVRASPEFDWRIVGGQVLESDGQLFDGLEAELRPPAASAAETAEHLAWADVFVLTSIWEGLPLALLEAMQMGAVPVATDVGGLREVVTDGVNGRLIPSDGEVGAAIVRALGDLDSDRAALAALSQAAIASMGERTWKDALQPVIDYLNREPRRRA